MAIFVRLELCAASAGRGRRARFDVRALVNSGYQADRAELILPAAVAGRLGWWPRLPRKAEAHEYGSAGEPFIAFRVPGALCARVKVPDRSRPDVICDAVISPSALQVLISDALGGALQIALVDLPGGLWAFRDEMHRLRPSEPER